MINVQWYKGCKTPQAKKDRKEMVFSAKPTLTLLKELLVKRVKEIDTNALTKAGYDTPAWAYLQADTIGSKRAYLEVLSLLDLGDTK